VLGRLATHPRHLDHAELGRLVRGEQQRFWATHLYSTWQHARIAGALTPLVLIVLLVALTQRIQRLGHVEYLFVSGLSLGFAFFIFSGVSLAMGEVGILPPPIAGWAPPLCFLAIAGAIAFWHEEARVPAAAPEGGDRRR
jgi:lipopolysaccharide export system permease protein